MSTSKTRPTKKQHETLSYIEGFIKEHGYSPSYREIMRGCNYTSVATVSLHVKNLIARGHLIKRGNSARSIEVVGTKDHAKQTHQHELVHALEERFKQLEAKVEEELLNETYVLIGALKVLGHVDLARTYAIRINEIM